MPAAPAHHRLTPGPLPGGLGVFNVAADGAKACAVEAGAVRFALQAGEVRIDRHDRAPGRPKEDVVVGQELVLQSGDAFVPGSGAVYELEAVSEGEAVFTCASLDPEW